MLPDIKYFFLFVIVLFFLHCVQTKETFLGDVVINAFSDMHCVDDSEPLVRLVPRQAPTTFQCLSRDGTGEGCIDRNFLNIPTDYACKNNRKNVNLFLSRDGIRQVNLPQSRNTNFGKVFHEFENLRTATRPRDPNMNLSLVTCTAKGMLAGDDHWCGRLWNKVQPICEKEKYEQGIFSSLCDNIQTTLQEAGENTTNETAIPSNTISILQRKAQCKSDCSRRRLGAACKNACEVTTV
jgi:hypothetical protein